MTISRASVSRSLALTFAGQIVLYMQGLVIMPIAIKLAGAETYGGYVLLSASMMIVYGISPLGAGYRFRRNLAATADPRERRALFETQFTFQASLLALVSVAFLLKGDAVQALLFGPRIRVANWVVPTWFAAYMLYSQVTDYFRYSLRFVHFNVGVGIYPSLFVASVALYALVQHSISLDALVLLQVGAIMVVVTPLLFIMLREIGVPRPRLTLAQLKSDIKIGFPLTMQFVVDTLTAYSDRYLIAFFMTLSAVGRYQPSYQIAAIITAVPKIAGAVLPPALSKMVDSGDTASAHALVRVFLRIFFMLAIPFVAGCAMVGPSIIALLTNSEIAAAGRFVCPAVAFGCLFYGVTLVAFQVAYVLGNTMAILKANAIGAGLNLGLNALLLWLHPDITIPALVSVVSFAVSCVYVMHVLKRDWPISLEWRRMGAFVTAAAVMAGVLYLMGFGLGAVAKVSLPRLLASIGAAITVYFTALHLLGGFGRHEWKQIVAIFRRNAPELRDA